MLKTLEKEVQGSKKTPDFRVGDTLRVSLKVQEGNKTRTQIFEGVCIRRRGSGPGQSFSVIKESHGDKIEKTFPLYSPLVEKVKVTRKAKKHSRARLYHLRNATA